MVGYTRNFGGIARFTFWKTGKYSLGKPLLVVLGGKSLIGINPPLYPRQLTLDADPRPPSYDLYHMAHSID
jgi:hypothetical protein